MQPIDKFINFENKLGLFEKRISGIKFWPFLRFTLYFQIIKQGDKISESYSKDKDPLFWTYLKKIAFKQLSNFFRHNAIFIKQPKDILVFNHPRRVRQGDFYDCLYTDKILEKLSHSYYVLETPYQLGHFKPIRTKNIEYLDFIKFCQAIRYKFFQTFGLFKFSQEEIAYINNLCQKINREFGISFEPEKLARKIKRIILKYKAIRPYYEKILSKARPKLIIEVVSYHFDCLILTEIAKKKNIPVIELQHGTMGRYHIAYNFLKASQPDFFPDYIFLYGQFWKETTRLPLKPEHILVTGSPYFEEKFSLKKEKTENKIKKILFISQTIIGEQLSRLARDFADLNQAEEYEIIYKLHPHEYQDWPKKYPWLKHENIRVIDNNEKDIYHFLAWADVQIGCFSTAIFEGLGFNLKTYIYKTYGAEYLEDLIAKKTAKLVHSAEEIINDLNKKSFPEQSISLYLWTNNSLAKNISSIENILSQKTTN